MTKTLKFVSAMILFFSFQRRRKTRDSIDKSDPTQNSDDIPDAATTPPPSENDVKDADRDD
ncbi:hypothetical protein RYX36_017338 [Vicia faba]